jgi:LacI family transcriptional regulator
MEAVRALNYRPNPAARVLAGARDTRIAIIYSNPSASYLSEMLVGALDGSHRTASQLVLDRWDNLKPAAEKAAAQRLSEGIAGVILPPPLCESKAIAAAFAAEGVPAVALATGRAREDVSCVRIDDFHAAREMTLHLIAEGHSRIAFIKGQPTQTASAQRLAGFEAAMEESGLEIDPSLVVQGFFSYKSGLEAAEKLLARKRIPTAIFASNDDMAAAAISVAHRRALDVPGDLSVVGFDDTPIATTVWPELTTIRQPIAAMAEAQGFLVVFSNPKALLLFGAFIPRFVDPKGDYVGQVLLLGATAMAVAVIFDSAYAVLTGRAAALLAPGRVRLLSRISGLCLIGGGVWLALARSR